MQLIVAIVADDIVLDIKVRKTDTRIATNNLVVWSYFPVGRVLNLSLNFRTSNVDKLNVIIVDVLNISQGADTDLDSSQFAITQTKMKGKNSKKGEARV